MPETSIDIFAKARDYERIALLRAAREADIVPYFRTVEGPGAARSSRWRARRGSCSGSNNYLGPHQRRARHTRPPATRWTATAPG